jgi:hypothetical protein
MIYNPIVGVTMNTMKIATSAAVLQIDKSSKTGISDGTLKLRFITQTFHGVIDYAAGLALITAPFILHLGNTSPAAIWLSVATGIAVVLVSILTKYRYALFRVIPFDLHLAIDLAAATAFVGIPFVFSFTGIDAAYYTINAAVVYLVVALTENRPTLIA